MCHPSSPVSQSEKDHSHRLSPTTITVSPNGWCVAVPLYETFLFTCERWLISDTPAGWLIAEATAPVKISKDYRESNATSYQACICR